MAAGQGTSLRGSFVTWGGNMGRTGRIFYGWVIVGCGVLITALTAGMIINTNNLFVVPICEELGFSRAQMSFAQTLFSVAAMLVSLFAGPIFAKFRLHRIMKLAAVGIGLFYFAYSRVSNLFVIYILAFLVSACSSLLTWMPFSVIISNWFHKRAGLALGITFMGSGIGGMIFFNILGALLGAFGWRTAMAVLSAICAAVVIPVVFFVLKISPYEMGLAPYGEEGERSLAMEEYGPGLHAVWKTRKFVSIFLCLVGIGFACNALASTQMPYLQDVGYSVSTSAMLSSCYMAVLIGGKVLLGAFTDRYGLSKMLVMVGVAMLAGFVCVYYAKFLPMAIATAILMGIFEPVSTVALPIIAHRVYGTRDYGAIAGLFTAASSIGCAIAPTAFGLIYDVAGGYGPGYLAMIVVTLACIALLLRAVHGANAEEQ